MSSKQKSKTAFVLALLLLCLSGIAAGFVIFRLYDAQAMVRHTYQVEVAIGNVESSLTEVGRARINFVASPSPESLKDFSDAVSQVAPALANLRALASDNGEQQALSSRMEENAAQRIAPSQKSVELMQQNLTSPTQELQLTSQVARAAFDTERIAQQMKRNEDTLLNRKSRLSKNLFTAILAILTSSFVLSGFMFWLHHNLLISEVRDRSEAENQLRKLSMQLLRVQDEERRRFARELHDGVGQTLAAAKILVVDRTRSEPVTSKSADLAALLDEAISQTRTISYLFHPPLLDEIGFSSAAKWLIEGFAQRTGLMVTADIQQPDSRLPQGLEITLYRVLQEALNNIHRHSKSKSVEVAVRIGPKSVTLRVKDDGNGIPSETLAAFHTNQAQAGVGLLSMKERVREQAGELKIESQQTGTEIVVNIPYSLEIETQSTTAVNAVL